MRLFVLLATCLLFSDVLAQKPDLYPVQKDKKYGYIDSKGKLIIPYQYLFADEFDDNGLAYVQNNTGAGMIDAAGKTIIPFEDYLYSTNGMDGMVFRRDYNNEKPSELYDREGNRVNIPYGEYHYINYPNIIKNNTVILVHGYKGVTSLSGQLVLPAVYNDIRMFNDGIMARKEDSWSLFDHNGKFLFSTKNDMSYSQWYGNMISFKNGQNFGMYDLKGEEVIGAKYLSIDNLNEGFASVEIGSGLEGYVDSTGKIVIEPKFKRTGKFYNGYACVSEDGDLYGLIDLKGNWVIQPKYENPFCFKDNVALVTQKIDEANRQHHLIDIKGKTIFNLTTVIGKDFFISENGNYWPPRADEHGVFSINTFSFYYGEGGTECNLIFTKQGKLLHKFCFANECFPAGSAVYMATGEIKNIEQIIPGDTITSYTGKKLFAVVKDVEIFEGIRSMVQIDFHQPYAYSASLTEVAAVPHQSVTSTLSHPFYTTQGLKLAGDLIVGDHIFYINPETNAQTVVEIKDITISEPKPVKVYNIKTDASGYVVNGIAVAVK